MRYTAREDTVFAFLANASGTITLSEVQSTALTAVTTIGGAALHWRNAGYGVVVDLPAGDSGPGPLVVALRNVRPR